MCPINRTLLYLYQYLQKAIPYKENNINSRKAPTPPPQSIPPPGFPPMGFAPPGFPPGMPPPPGMNFMVPPPGMPPMVPMVPVREESEYR